MKALPPLDPATFFPNHYAVRMAQTDLYLGEVTAEFICELFGRGYSPTAVATFLHISMPRLVAWFSDNGARAGLFDRARVMAAQALVDEATEILERATQPSGPNARSAKDLADHYKWLAERMHPERFGTKVAQQLPVPGVIFNIQMPAGMKTISVDAANLPALDHSP